MGHRMWYEIKDIHLCSAVNPMAWTGGFVHLRLFLVTYDRRCRFEHLAVTVKRKRRLRLCGIKVNIRWGKTTHQFFKTVFFLIAFSRTTVSCRHLLPIQSPSIPVSGHWLTVSPPIVFKSSSTTSVPSSQWSSFFPCSFHSGCHYVLAFFHYSVFQYVHTIFKWFHKFFKRVALVPQKLMYENKKS